MLAIGTRLSAPCCARTSPVVPSTTRNARAFTFGTPACAEPASVRAAAATAISRFNTSSTLAHPDPLADVQALGIDSGIEAQQLLDSRVLLERDRTERVAALDRVVAGCGGRRRRRGRAPCLRGRCRRPRGGNASGRRLPGSATEPRFD